MEDNWSNRRTKKCEFCINWVRKNGSKTGRCRANPPTMDGWPVTFEDDWCGKIKLNPKRFISIKMPAKGAPNKEIVETAKNSPGLSWADVVNKTVADTLVWDANQMDKKKDVLCELIDMDTPDIVINVPRSDNKTFYGCDFGPGNIHCVITGYKHEDGVITIDKINYGKGLI